jgi:DUF4097 and DUF4098 domain-containing protein YvlB
MIRFFIRLTALAIVASLPVPIQAQGPETTEKISKSFKVGPSGTLDISNISGTILVSEGGTDTIVIDAVKQVRGSASDAKDQLTRTVVEMVERAGRVDVKTVYSGSKMRTSVDYRVTAPAGTNVYAHSMSGDVKVTNIRGEVRADTVSGDVVATATPGATLVRTVSGDASASGVSNPNELRVSSVSGDVTLTGAKVRTVDADSISGTVTLADVACERATAKSLSGNILFTGPLAKGGRYQLQAQSGDIRIVPGGAQGFEVDASSFSGDIRSEFQLTLPAGQPVGGQGPRKSLRGVFGDGGAQLLLRAFSGNITIAKK